MLELDGTLIVAIISFIIFGIIMNAVLYQPIIKILDEREQYIKDNTKTAQKAKEEAEGILNQREEELQSERSSASKDVSERTKLLKQSKEEETENFSKKQKEKIEAEKARLEEEANQSQEELEYRVTELSEIIVTKVLGGRNV